MPQSVHTITQTREWLDRRRLRVQGRTAGAVRRRAHRAREPLRPRLPDPQGRARGDAGRAIRWPCRALRARARDEPLLRRLRRHRRHPRAVRAHRERRHRDVATPRRRRRARPAVRSRARRAVRLPDEPRPHRDGRVRSDRRARCASTPQLRDPSWLWNRQLNAMDWSTEGRLHPTAHHMVYQGWRPEGGHAADARAVPRPRRAARCGRREETAPLLLSVSMPDLVPTSHHEWALDDFPSSPIFVPRDPDATRHESARGLATRAATTASSSCRSSPTPASGSRCSTPPPSATDRSRHDRRPIDAVPFLLHAAWMPAVATAPGRAAQRVRRRARSRRRAARRPCRGRASPSPTTSRRSTDRMTGVINVRRDPYLSGVYAPVDTERDDADLADHGAPARRRSCGMYPAQRSEPDVRAEGPLPRLRRRRHGPRRHASPMGGRRTATGGCAPTGSRPRCAPVTRSTAAWPTATSRLAGGDRRRPADEERGQHQRDPPRGTHPVSLGGRLGRPSSTPDLSTIGAVRLRRRVRRAVHRAPQARSRHRRDARLRLLAVPAVPHLPRGRRRRHARADGRHRPPGAGDDARLRDHRPARGVPRRAGRLRLRSRSRRAGRCSSWKPELGTRFGVLDRDGGGRRGVGRDRPLLRLPLPQRVVLARRPHGHRRRRAGCRGWTSAWTPRAATADADSWLHRFTIDLDAAARRATSRSPSSPATSRGSRRRWRARPPVRVLRELLVGRGRGRRLRLGHQGRLRRRAPTATHVYGAATAVSGEAVFAPDPGRRPPRTAVGCSTSSPTGSTDDPTSWSSTRRRSKRWRGSHFRQRVPFGFHGNWLAAG